MNIDAYTNLTPSLLWPTIGPTRDTGDNGPILKRPRVVINKKLSYRRGTARRAVSVKTVLNVAQMFVELHLISPALNE